MRPYIEEELHCSGHLGKCENMGLVWGHMTTMSPIERGGK